MMKYIALLLCAFCLAQSQRPPYAGTSNRYPVVLPQFMDEQSTTPAAGSLANRIDPTGSVNTANPSSSSSSGPANSGAGSSVLLPSDLPVDARGDIELINRIKTWPKEKQPFWFINWQQIQEHLGDSNNRGQPAAPVQSNTRGSFSG